MVLRRCRYVSGNTSVFFFSGTVRFAYDLEELGINPINQATINDLHFHEGKDLSFSAQFEVEPQFQLPKYNKKIKVRAIRYNAENEDIEQTLNQY